MAFYSEISPILELNVDSSYSTRPPGFMVALEAPQHNKASIYFETSESSQQVRSRDQLNICITGATPNDVNIHISNHLDQLSTNSGLDGEPLESNEPSKL